MESSDFQVRLVVEQLYDDGSVEEVSSEVLREFSNDETEDTVGEGSDSYFNEVIRKCR